VAALVASGLVAAAALTGCSGDDEPDEPAPSEQAAGGSGGPAQPPAPVELTVETSEPARIGVLLAVSTEPGQGQDVLPAAQGAEVAAFRLGLDGGTAPELVVEIDDGTPAGARRAMSALVDGGVSGVLVASTGDHLAPAVQAAASDGVAVLAPYWRPRVDVPDGVWLTGPSTGAVDQRMQEVLQSQGLDSTLVVTGDGVSVDGVPSVQTATFRGNNPTRLLDRIGRLVEDGEIDSVVIGASAPAQARLVTLLQGEQPDLPVVLTPEALSPVFPEALLGAGGTTSGRFTTVGPDATDTTTLSSTPEADSVASFFAALRLAAGDPEQTDLLGERPFADVADSADAISHDAVVALVRAVAEAGDGDPRAVRDALGGLSLGRADGLAGPPLDFGGNPTMAADDVVVLQGTSQDPGVRPSPTPLTWFAVPAADAAAGG
jgi:hypothetical protein